MNQFKNYEFIKCNPLIVNLLDNFNYITPSEIQKKIIDLLQYNINIKFTNKINLTIINSQFGSGKTLAFLIILLYNFQYNNKSIQSIIITPTRELCFQIEDYFKIFNNNILTYKILIGGKANETKKKKFNLNNINIIIGTLGKIYKELKIKNKNKINNIKNLSNLNTIIIDEADKMINQNKNNNFSNILKVLYSIIQNNLNENNKISYNLILCSASFTKDIIEFYNNIFNFNILNYNFVTDQNSKNISKENKYSLKQENIYEFYIKIPNKKNKTSYESKYEILSLILIKLINFYNQSIIFYNKKSLGEELASDLRDINLNTCFIYGDLSQDQRQIIYEKIKNLDYKIIITTDLLSRGIDLNLVNLIINLDLPFDYINYNHRIGRTGRYFTKGIAITFIEEDEINKFNNTININNKIIELNINNDNNFLDIIKKYFHFLGKNERYKKEEIKKIKNNPNNIYENKLFDVENLSKKRRREKYKKESLISKWKKINKINNLESKNINNKNNVSIYNNSLNKENKQFCLYCDLFKIFDI